MNNNFSLFSFTFINIFMKKLFPFLVCILLFENTITAQTYTSSCTVTPAINTNFKVDVSRLCIARLNETNSPYKDSIEIQQTLYDTVMRVMAVMSNMQPSNLKDTISDLFFFTNFLSYTPFEYESDSSHIHTVGSGPLFSPNSVSDVTRLKYFSIYVDTGLAWVKQWVTGNFTNSSNSAIDSFVNKYVVDITKTSLIYFGKQYQFILKTASTLNINALIKSFPDTNATTAIYANYYYGDAQRLIFEYQSAGIVAHYLTGCGDCISGCIHQKIWHFYIPYDSCIVHYLGSNFYSVLSPTEIVCLRGTVTPIEFGSITANKQGNNNQINFTTLTEVNIKNYQIERSSNAKDFVTINSLTANNKNSGSYAVIDTNPLSGNNYYRVKAIENNGVISYSKIVLLKNDDVTINVYPNPSKGLVHILIPRESKGVWNIKVQDVLGRVLQQQTTTALTKSMDMVVSQQKGFYYVTMVNKSTNKTIVKKVVVE
jgi:hypothetical protein